MAHVHPEPIKLFHDLLRLDTNYGLALEGVVAVYPTYAAQPGAPGASELFSEDSAELQTAQADLFLYRDKLEVASAEIAEEIGKQERIIREFETEDTALSAQLAGLDMQVDSAGGRLRDAVYLYREAYLANLLLGLTVLAGAYGTYKSIRAVSAS